MRNYWVPIRFRLGPDWVPIKNYWVHYWVPITNYWVPIGSLIKSLLFPYCPPFFLLDWVPLKNCGSLLPPRPPLGTPTGTGWISMIIVGLPGSSWVSSVGAGPPWLLLGHRGSFWGSLGRPWAFLASRRPLWQLFGFIDRPWEVQLLQFEGKSINASRKYTSVDPKYECRLFENTHTDIHIYIYPYIRPYIHRYLHTDIQTYTHIHTHMHTYIHTYIHTYLPT